MRSQGQPAKAAVASQAPASAGGAASQIVAEGQSGLPGITAGELASLSYQQLRARLNELQTLRSNLASRRDGISTDYERASGANRDGIGKRLEILDHNIVVYEQQIAAVGQEMAKKAPARETGTTSTRIEVRGYDEGEMVGAVFGTFVTTALLMVLVGRVFGRRRRMGAPARANEVNSGERFDRIEQAVDSIAVEMERVSENQRFMTRLMTETQLGDTLKDVRKSTELAKSAASEGS